MDEGSAFDWWVLLVEDDPKMRGAVSRLLRRRGCEVVHAEDVDSAIAQLDARSFDLVILDVRLGRGSGVEVAEHAARIRPTPALVAISGRARPDEAFALAQLGVRTYMPKIDLLERFDELLERADRPTDLTPHVRSQVGHVGLKETVSKVRREMVDQALAKERESPARAARQLKVSRQAVQQLKRRLDLGEEE